MGFTDNYSKKPPTTPRKSLTEQKIINERRLSERSGSIVDDTFLFNIYHENDDVDGNKSSSTILPDQEILDSTDSIYFQENVDTNIYELRVCMRKPSMAFFFTCLLNFFQLLFIRRTRHFLELGEKYVDFSYFLPEFTLGPRIYSPTRRVQFRFS